MIKENHISPFLSASTWTGAVASGVGAITLAEWLAIGGFLVALAGFFVNLWHKRKMVRVARERLKLEFPEAEHSKS